jgi:pimeloyl-ACP methyl ester carboxylesterase
MTGFGIKFWGGSARSYPAGSTWKPGFLSMTETVHDLADERPVYFYNQFGCGRSNKAFDPDFYLSKHYCLIFTNLIADLSRQIRN